MVVADDGKIFQVELKVTVVIMCFSFTYIDGKITPQDE